MTQVLLDSLNASSDAVDFTTSVRRHSWEWLLQLRRRLNIEVQIIDGHGVFLLPDAAEAATAAFRHPEFDETMKRALQSRQTESVRIDRIQAICVGLTTGTTIGGLLVVARDLSTEAGRSTDAPRDLELLASWLRSAIEAHLTSAQTTGSEDVRRLSALRRLLAEAAETPSEPSLFRIFSQALAIWEDLEAYFYVDNRRGQFVRQSSPAGEQQGDFPATLAVDMVPPGRELARLSRQVIEQLGIQTSEDVATAVLGTGEGEVPWLLVLSGTIRVAAESRLALYLDFLEQHLHNVTVSATLRLHRAVWGHLLEPVSEEDQAANALADIRLAVNADAGALAITLPRGGHAISVGDTAAFADLQGPLHDNRLTVVRSLPTQGTVAVAVGRFEGPPFMSFDEGMLESAVETLVPWAAAVVRRPENGGERRAATPSFEETIEQVAARAVERGASVSIVVIRLKDAVFRPGLTNSVAASIKTHLRAAEPAGALSDGEIGAVLYDTTPEQAQMVVARLRRLVAAGDERAALASASVGFAHCPAGSAVKHSLLVAARRGAAKSPRGRAAGTSLQ